MRGDCCGDYRGKLVVAPNSLNYPYRKLERQMTFVQRLAAVNGASRGQRVRSPRLVATIAGRIAEAALRAAGRHCGAHGTGGWWWPVKPLSPDQRALAQRLGLMERIVEIGGASNELLGSALQRRARSCSSLPDSRDSAGPSSRRRPAAVQ